MPPSTKTARVDELVNPGDRLVVGLPFEFKVAGTGYERRYSAIRRYCKMKSVVRLTPEHDNPYDKHAVAVQLCWTNAAKKEVWEMIGYVPSEASEQVNELLASGEWAIDNAFVRRFDASPDFESPKVIVRLEGKDLRFDQKVAPEKKPKGDVLSAQRAKGKPRDADVG